AIGQKATSVSVRGHFTKEMLESVIGSCDERVFITGCPSYYSNPDAFNVVKAKITEGITGPLSVNLTDYRRDAEKILLEEAVTNNHFLIEPSNKDIHNFAVHEMNSRPIAIPQEFNFLLNGTSSQTSEAAIRE